MAAISAATRNARIDTSYSGDCMLARHRRRQRDASVLTERSSPALLSRISERHQLRPIEEDRRPFQHDLRLNDLSCERVVDRRELDALHLATALDSEAATVVTFDPRLRDAVNLVTLTFASWNLIRILLRRIDSLRQAA
jgi:predicted nucleic acid-binding protein